MPNEIGALINAFNFIIRLDRGNIISTLYLHFKMLKSIGDLKRRDSFE